MFSGQAATPLCGPPGQGETARASSEVRKDFAKLIVRKLTVHCNVREKRISLQQSFFLIYTGKSLSLECVVLC